MSDTYVELLKYTLEKDDSVVYEAPDLQLSTPEFTGLLSDGKLTIYPTQRWSTEDEARAAVEPFLKSWQVSVGLQHGHDVFCFAFVGSRSIHPSAPDNMRYTVTGAGRFRVGSRGRGQAVHKNYPPFPVDFAATKLVNELWTRFNNYIDQQEPLPAMAYYCLTALERGSNRKEAARKFGIHLAVLNKIAELSSTKGDSRTARKAKAVGPLSAREQAWLEEAIKRVVRHRGEGTRAPLTMVSLPPL